MTNKYGRGSLKTIKDFLSVKGRCIFCQTALRKVLTNFIGIGKDGIPVLNTQIENDIINFNVDWTTDYYSIAAKGQLDINTNVLTFTSDKEDATFLVADVRPLDAFSKMKPHMELYCPNKKCKMKYTISSDVFVFTNSNSPGSSWKINTPSVWMETFIIGNLWVQNDWVYSKTNIYSRNNPDANPITVDLIDFESMSKEKLLTRIKTLVTFG